MRDWSVARARLDFRYKKLDSSRNVICAHGDCPSYISAYSSARQRAVVVSIVEERN